MCHETEHSYTRTTESLAAIVRMSAQDTTPGHSDSISDFMASISSNPLNEFAFGAAVFSPTKLGVSSNSTDASHPCKTFKNYTDYARPVCCIYNLKRLTKKKILS